MEIRNLNDFIKPPRLPELSEMEALGSIYESPITLVAGEMQTTMEANCVKVVQIYGFDVNAEELAKALAYDRDQYDKGYADARKKYERPHGSWHHSGECSVCKNRSLRTTPTGDIIGIDFTDFCKNCGADMREEDENGSI